MIRTARVETPCRVTSKFPSIDPDPGEDMNNRIAQDTPGLYTTPALDTYGKPGAHTPVVTPNGGTPAKPVNMAHILREPPKPTADAKSMRTVWLREAGRFGAKYSHDDKTRAQAAIATAEAAADQAEPVVAAMREAARLNAQLSATRTKLSEVEAAAEQLAGEIRAALLKGAEVDDLEDERDKKLREISRLKTRIDPQSQQASAAGAEVSRLRQIEVKRIRQEMATTCKQEMADIDRQEAELKERHARELAALQPTLAERDAHQLALALLESLGVG